MEKTKRKIKAVLICVVLAGFLCIVGINSIDKKERRAAETALWYKEILEGEKERAKDNFKQQKVEEKNQQENQKRDVHTGAFDKNYDGYIDCLLEIPKINMCQAVITGGNVEDNLSNHYFTAARADMSYGKGGYVVFGHQSFINGKGMNRVDELVVGDCIYISGKKFYDVYEIIEILESHKGEDSIDFTEDNNHLALYTCRKQRERPKPYMIIRAVKRS